MIEAVMCGTPVVADRRGSVPEVVDDNVRGFIVESAEEAVAVVSEVAHLDRRTTRRRFEERFSARRELRRSLRTLSAGGFVERRGVLQPERERLWSCHPGRQI
jgi:glycosyltransferase involved in cell wall biosynthesis